MIRIPALQAELVRAARRQSAERPWWARFGRRRFLIVALAVLAVAGGTAGAERWVTKEGPPIKPAPAADFTPAHGMVAPVRGTERIVATAPNPGGGLPWGLRVSNGRDGSLCTGVGQVLHGRLGTVDRDGIFHRLPLLGPDTCTRRVKRDEVGWFVDGRPAPGLKARIVPNRPSRLRVYAVNGLAGSDVERVEVVAPHFRRSLTPRAHGGFIAVVPGTVTIYDISIVGHFRDGSVQTFGGRAPRTPRFDVEPASGGRSATFVVRFRAPYPADDPRDAYTVQLRLPRGGCSQGLTTGMLTIPAPASATVGIPLNPANAGSAARSWCSGRYKGFVQFADYRPGVHCSPSDEKAGFCSRERPVGRFFTFRVR
jgi:hypothetical protein